MSKGDTDFLGKKVHLLTPQRSYKKGKHVYWECLCDCGNITHLRRRYLVEGSIKSCGCLRKLTTLSVEQVADAYGMYVKKRLSIKSIATHFGCSERVIELSFKRAEYPVRDRSHQRRQYYINEHVFDTIDTEEKAYWLGFLYADGSITDHRCVSVKLADKDEDHLKRFSRFVFGCDRVKSYIKEDDRRVVYLHATNASMVAALAKWGCVSRKTFLLKFPKWLRQDLVPHFVRGYFDGDGSIGIYDKKVRSRRGKGIFTGTVYPAAAFSVLSTMEFLSALKDIFESLSIHSFIYKRHKDRDNNNFTMNVAGNQQIERLLDWLYKDATIYLPRKRDKYLELKAINQRKRIFKH